MEYYFSKTLQIPFDSAIEKVTEELKKEGFGTMLLCNVIVQELPDDKVEVAAIDPLASMQAIENPSLKGVAQQVREMLKKVVENL